MKAMGYRYRFLSFSPTLFRTSVAARTNFLFLPLTSLPKFYICRRDPCLSPSWQGNDALNEYRWYWRVPGQSDNGLNFAAVGRQSFGFLTSRHSIDSPGEALGDFLVVQHCEIAIPFTPLSPIVERALAFLFMFSSLFAVVNNSHL